METKTKADLKPVQIQNIRTNIMGTTSFEMKFPGMRKFQDFIVYPIKMDDSAKILTIQSDTRFGHMSLASGIVVSSASHANGAYSHSYMMDKAAGKTQAFRLEDVDRDALRLFVFTTATSKAGENGVVYTDNSGAFRII